MTSFSRKNLTSTLVSIIALAAIASAQRASAYANFIAYGYTSCLTCHFNPYGNGPLTDYGRGLSATAISGRPPFVAATVTDEQLGEASGFLGTQKLPEWLRLSANYRGLVLMSQIGKQNSSTNYYNMQSDVSVTLKSPESKWIASATVGLADDENSKGSKTNDGPLISREHYVGTRLNDEWGIYAGFMDVAYGIRIPDHEAFSRSFTQLKQNDQTHGVLTHYATETIEAGVHAFVGNLYQDAALRPKGVSGIFEYEAWKKSRIGASVYYAKNDFRTRKMTAVHLRTALKEGHSILAETGLVFENSVIPSSQHSQYVFVQSLHRLFRGFHVMGNAEYGTLNFDKPGTRYVNVGPALQWFPFQRLELRSDLQGAWALSSTGNAFHVNWTAQAHLTF